MPSIEFRKLRKQNGEPGRLFGRKAAVLEPQSAQAVHLVVRSASADMLFFQGVHALQKCSQFRPVEATQTGEETLLLVGGMLRCGFAEVSERSVPGHPLVV